MVVCGARGCGKTSVLEKLIYGNNGPFSSTIEDVYVANIETDRGTKEKIRFYDTAGLDAQQREVPRHLLAAADGFVIVYSVEDKQSFNLAEAIRKEIKNCGEKKDQVALCSFSISNFMTRLYWCWVLRWTWPKVVKLILDKLRCLNFGRHPPEKQLTILQAWALNEKLRLAEVSALDRHSLYEPFMYLASKLNPPPNKSALAQITSTIKRQGNEHRRPEQD